MKINLKKKWKMHTRNSTEPGNSAITKSIREMGVLWEYCLKNIHNYPRCIFTSLIILPKEVTQTQVLTMNRRFKTFTMSSFLKQVHMKMSLHAESLYNLFLNQFSRRQWKVNIKKLTSLVSFAMAQKTLLWLKRVYLCSFC